MAATALKLVPSNASRMPWHRGNKQTKKQAAQRSKRPYLTLYFSDMGAALKGAYGSQGHSSSEDGACAAATVRLLFRQYTVAQVYFDDVLIQTMHRTATGIRTGYGGAV